MLPAPRKPHRSAFHVTTTPELDSSVERDSSFFRLLRQLPRVLAGADVGAVQESPSGHGVLEGLLASAVEADLALEGKDGFVLQGTVAPSAER